MRRFSRLLLTGLWLASANFAAHAQEATPAAPVQPVANPGFSAWLDDYARAAQSRGLDAAAIAATTDGLSYSPRVVELDRAQPDDSARTQSLFSDYLSRRLDGSRINRGRALHDDMAAKFADIEARTGVPANIILGIWGMESSYGVNTGSFDVPRAVASLAYDGRRRELFTRELDASVAIVAKGLARRDELKGSWAGAMGQPQFLPSSYLAYAVDGDGDGHADIWNSNADVAASVGNYLAKNGWRRGQSWGMRVVVPGSLERWRVRNLVQPDQCVRPMQRHSRWISVGEWKALGLIPMGKPWPADDTLATLVEPDGPGTPAYLTFGNYRALMAYNCSNFYALSVALLGDAIDQPGN
jgi:lytic murein transglycosylase